jgi:hypothetical protein
MVVGRAAGHGCTTHNHFVISMLATSVLLQIKQGRLNPIHLVQKFLLIQKCLLAIAKKRWPRKANHDPTDQTG